MSKQFNPQQNNVSIVKVAVETKKPSKFVIFLFCFIVSQMQPNEHC